MRYLIIDEHSTPAELKEAIGNLRESYPDVRLFREAFEAARVDWVDGEAEVPDA